jgi:ubiquinone/menaquinone biosynthesis C-methylase UbiE
MPDVYANITSVADKVVQQIADVLELRATDPQQRAMREAYLSEIFLPENARALDVGCGTGALTRVLAGWPNVGAVVGLDPSPILLDRARRESTHSGITFEMGDARTLPFDTASFDLTLFHTTLCHVPEPERALAEALRVLRPGGWLAVFDGDYATTTSIRFRPALTHGSAPASTTDGSCGVCLPWPAQSGSKWQVFEATGTYRIRTPST